MKDEGRTFACQRFCLRQHGTLFLLGIIITLTWFKNGIYNVTVYRAARRSRAARYTQTVTCV